MKYFTALFLLGMLWIAGSAFGDYQTNTSNKGAAPEWIKNTVPGEGHKIFKDLVGTWKHTSKFWMDANAKPEESKGTSTSKLIMGGRFLQTDYKGTAMGKPFTGMGLLGFDSIKGEYQSTWVDSMSTALMTSTGTYDAATKTLTENGSSSCPMTGEKNKAFRGEWKFQDKNNYTYAMYANGTDGKEFKNLEIAYKRN